MSDYTEIRPEDLRAGRHSIQIDAVEPPDDPGEVAAIFEEVVMVEDMGRCWRVFTEHHEVILRGEELVRVLERA